MVSPLVTTEWLKSELEKSTDRKSKLILLDATWMPTMNGHDFYAQLHIPGAQYFDIQGCGQPTKEIPRVIPESALFQKYLRSFGICKDSYVIVYDRDDGDKIITIMADRVWWLLRLFGINKVSILDGGLHKWKNEGYPTSNENEHIKLPEGDVECHLEEKLIRTFAEMKRIVDEESSQIIDTRLEDHFHGRLPEPNEFTLLSLEDSKFPPLKEEEICGGHMKNAKNIPFTSFTKENSPEHLPREEYLKLFQKAEIDLKKPVIATCYIGHSACYVAVAAAICGEMGVTIYPGSWTEWGQRHAPRKSDV